MSGEQLFEIARKTVDTPEFRGIEFIEVEAKSVINRVAGNGVPFNCSRRTADGFSETVRHRYRIGRAIRRLRRGRSSSISVASQEA